MPAPEALPPQERRLIIGLGNEYRNDDAAGLIVARRLKDQPHESMTVLEQSGEGAALIDAWQEAQGARVVVIDAVQAGAKPGTIYRFDALRERLPAKFFNYSTHAFSVAEAIELARAMNLLPATLVVYGIEGKNFDSGVGLSPEVEQAANAVTEMIRRECTESAPSRDTRDFQPDRSQSFRAEDRNSSEEQS